MSSVLRRGEDIQKTCKGKMAMHGQRHRPEWRSYKATMVEATRSEGGPREDSCPEPLEGAWPCYHLGIRLLGPRAVTVQCCFKLPRKLTCPDFKLLCLLKHHHSSVWKPPLHTTFLYSQHKYSCHRESPWYPSLTISRRLTHMLHLLEEGGSWVLYTLSCPRS